MTAQLRRFVAITAGSGMFVMTKTGLVWVLDENSSLAPWLIYLLVTLSVTVLGWLYHSKVSFNTPLTGKTFVRYLQQAALLKTVDYCFYTLLVYLLRVSVTWAVLATGAVVFTMRVIVYTRYVFNQAVPNTRTELTGLSTVE